MSKKNLAHDLNEIKELLSEDTLKVAGSMIDDAMFMESMLKKLREQIAEEGASENYQYGSKPTAAMTTYLQIQKQYGVIIRYLTDLIPESSKKKAGTNDELLEFLGKR